MMEKHMRKSVGKNDPSMALLNNALLGANGSFEHASNEDENQEGLMGASEQLEEEEEDEEMEDEEENYEMDEYEDGADTEGHLIGKGSHSLMGRAQNVRLEGEAGGKGGVGSAFGGSLIKIEQNEKMIKKNKVIELYSKGERCVRKLSQLTGNVRMWLVDIRL